MSKFGLLLALFRTLPWPILKAIPARLLFVGLQFSQPFLLFEVVSAVRYGTSSEIASGLIGATAFIFIGIAVCFYPGTNFPALMNHFPL